jgi:LysM repeat protein
MKTSFLVSAVVAAHCVAVGSAFLIQGCGTTRGPVTLPTETPMPPAIEEEIIEADIPVAPVKPVTPVAPEAKSWPVEATTTYIVAKGDTLSQIARRYGITVAEVMTLNGIGNPDSIRIGQKLVLPGNVDINKPVKPAVATPKKPAKELPAGANAYVVQPGDCLSVIASKAGVTTKALRDANNLKGDTIFVGQTLAIPGGKKISTKPAAEPAIKPVAPPVAPAPSLPMVQEAPAGFDVPELPEAVEEALPVADLPPELPTPTASATVYTVRAGDDILTVASEHNVSIADLRRVNRLASDLLVPGQKLVIPTQD